MHKYLLYIFRIFLDVWKLFYLHNYVHIYNFTYYGLPAGLRKVGGSTRVPARDWNNARRGNLGLPPPIKAGKNLGGTFRMARLECTVAHMGFPASTSNKRIKKRFTTLITTYRTLSRIQNLTFYVYENGFVTRVSK
jgi:hypothetical protein